MGWIFSTFLVLETLVAILVLPVLLAAVCWLALRLIDNRGLYSVSPFLELAIAAGGLIEAFVLRSTGLGSQLAPDQIWAANDVWSINLQGLYETSLAPPVLAALGSGALSVLIASWPAASLWIMAYGLTLLPVVVVAGFAWRSPRALVAAVLFLPISMTFRRRPPLPDHHDLLGRPLAEFLGPVRARPAVSDAPPRGQRPQPARAVGGRRTRKPTTSRPAHNDGERTCPLKP